MNGAQRFKSYLAIIPYPEREEWIFSTLGNMSDEIDALKKEIAKLKAHKTRQKNRNKITFKTENP